MTSLMLQLPDTRLKRAAMRLAPLLVLVAVPVAGPVVAQGSAGCSFPLDTSSATALPLRSLAGVFALEWHSVSKVGARRPPDGQLWLWTTAATDSSLRHPGERPDPNDTLRFPLFGTVARDVVIGAADSLRRSTDPIDPPVLLEAGRAGEPPVLLFGTVATRQAGVMALDGAGVGVSLTHIGPRTLAGTFSAWGIIREDSGYVCARRVE